MAQFYLSFLLFVSTVFLGISSSFADNDAKVYIVNMGGHPTTFPFKPARFHLDMLRQIMKRRSAARSLLYSYKNCFNGFAARLNPQQLEQIKKMAGVVGVHESKTYMPQTTRSWDFMGFTRTINRNPQVESDIIIGMIDSGAWPESESFRDDGMGPPPKKWKGICQTNGNFTCNNKLIGARFYKFNNTSPNDSARDNVGHGTHTASIVAGREVENANMDGLGSGTARGGMPSARIAIYKACWPKCDECAVLAAMDDAVEDGVDILSMSLVVKDEIEGYDADSVSIGAFHAMRRGVLTSQGAGNGGPGPMTLGSWAPWILTVAASFIDRQFVNKVQLGNGKTIEGIAVNSFDIGGKTYPLIDGCDCNKTKIDMESCEVDMKGKIAFCDSEEGKVLKGIWEKGAVGLVTLIDSVNGDNSNLYPVPNSRLTPPMFNQLKAYAKSVKQPQATILKSVEQNYSAAPMAASFSSRGPNGLSANILKPDISAPGVSILAAYPSTLKIMGEARDPRSAKYIIKSGTSLACPHATAAAAYIKSFHPQWSPAAIKSALITTAFPMKGKQKTAGDLEDIFMYGAGHMDPLKAVDPGLVYDASEQDYFNFLCSQGYRGLPLERVTGIKKATCPDTFPETNDLNYPSMTIAWPPPPFTLPVETVVVNFTRTVMNVGCGSCTYKATLSHTHPAFNISIEPSTLQFKALGEQKTFVVTVVGSFEQLGKRAYDTALILSDGVHTVRSPILVYSTKEFFGIY